MCGKLKSSDKKVTLKQKNIAPSTGLVDSQKRWESLTGHKHPRIRFLSIIINEIEAIYQNLSESAFSLDNIKFILTKECIRENIHDDAIKIFAPMIEKACVLEMHKLKASNLLEGFSSIDRFNFFIQLCQKGDFRTLFFTSYPVLKSLLDRKINNYKNSMLLFIEQLNDNLYEIESVILGGKLKRIIKLEASGDSHRGGKRVLIVHGCLENDKQKSFVYKPRSISNELFFSKLCSWYNKHGKGKSIKTPRLLDKNSHGYSEHISYIKCNSEEDMSHFYISLGQITALLLLINGRDIHHENIIANGKFPVLIDLECILSPVLPSEENYYSNVSQMRVLPRRDLVSKKNMGINNSSINDNLKEKSWVKVSVWHAEGTDEMRLIKEEVVYKAVNKNTPTLRNKSITTYKNIEEDYLNGFSQTYHDLVSNREYLQSSGSPLHAIGHVAVRVLFRSTNDYAKLLLESYHPSLLSCPQKYQNFINWLSEYLIYHPSMSELIFAENYDIMQGDIPYFQTDHKASFISNSQGKPLNIKTLYTGLEQAHRILAQLSESDFRGQTQLIKLSFLTNNWNKKNSKIFQARARSNKSDSKFCTKKIISNIINCSLENDKTIVWPEVSYHHHKAYSCDLGSLSLNTGSMGIAFALAYWDKFKQCKQSKRVVQKVLESCLRHCKNHKALQLGISGLSGLLFSAHHISSCGYPLAIELSELLVRKYSDQVYYNDSYFDVMYGSSLDVASMLLFKDNYSISDDVIHHAMRHLKHNCPEPRKFNLDASDTFGSGELHPPNLGYAHGISGVATAFIRYAERYNDKFSLDWVAKTLNILEKYFNHDLGYWPNMAHASRVNTVQEIRSKPLTWCQGHVGIGFFYLECYKKLPSFSEQAFAGLKRCIKIITKSAEDTKPLADLCCGFYADLDFLLSVNKLDMPIKLGSISQAIDKLALAIESHSIQDYSISLFHGLPSFLYLLLRYEHPNAMPCVLHWE